MDTNMQHGATDSGVVESATKAGCAFYLGAHRPNWLSVSDVPLFVSQSTLGKIKGALPVAKTRWALDSGAFTEISTHGHHRMSSVDYAARVQRYHREIGQLDFASVQDWMCEPIVLKKTGLTVYEHQRRTVGNYIELAQLAPEVPWMPVLQGWSVGEYLDHVEMYRDAGVDLRALDRVGVGSVCRRQSGVKAALVLSLLAEEGLKLHGFGVKATGLELAAKYLTSADSLAWSTHERSEHNAKRRWDPTLPKTGRQNDLSAAIDWLNNTVEPAMLRAA